MLFMNEYDIEDARRVLADTEAARFADYLHEFVGTVNEKSDGWAHWSAAPRSAAKLMTALQAAVEVARGRSRGEMPTEAEFTRALSPMKSLATKHGLRKVELAEAEAPAPRM